MSPFPRVTDFESWKEHFMLNARTECAITGVQHWVSRAFHEDATYAEFTVPERVTELQRLDGHLMKLIARVVETNLSTEDGRKKLTKMGDDGASIRSLSLKLQKITVDNRYEVSGRLLLMVINDHYTINGRDRFLPVHSARDIEIGGKTVEDLELFWYAWNDRIKHINYDDLVSDISIPIIRDHFYAQVRQCTTMWSWVFEYERSQPSRASPNAGPCYSYQHLAEGVRYLIEKRSDERNKRLIQNIPGQDRRHERDRRDRGAAPGAEQDPRKRDDNRKKDDRRKKERQKPDKHVKACAAFNKGKCQMGDNCPGSGTATRKTRPGGSEQGPWAQTNPRPGETE